MEDLIDSILRGVRIIPKCGKENNQHENFQILVVEGFWKENSSQFLVLTDFDWQNSFLALEY